MTDAAWRDVHDGRVWRAQACRIVEETAELIALWIPRGTSTFLPIDREGKRIRIPGDDWELEPVESWMRDAVCLARPGRAHSIYVFWQEGAFEHWYVNLEQPLRRTPIGFDTFDADAVRAEAARVLEEWPFPTGWEDWRPDPAWPIPQLPDGWKRV